MPRGRICSDRNGTCPLPSVVVDRYVLRGLNDMTSESQYVKIVLPGDGEFESAKGKVEKFKEGMVVSRTTSTSPSIDWKS